MCVVLKGFPHVILVSKKYAKYFSFFFNNMISFMQMFATINTLKVQAPFGVSLLHHVLIILSYNQNYHKYLLTFPSISFFTLFVPANKAKIRGTCTNNMIYMHGYSILSQLL